MREWDFAGLRAIVSCTLRKSPGVGHNPALVEASATIMGKHGVEVEVLRAIDHPGRS